MYFTPSKGEEVEKSEYKLLDGTALRLIQIGILTVYFYGGVHKLVHGFWLEGEFLIQTLFKQGNGGLGKTLGFFWNSLTLIGQKVWYHCRKV